MIHDSLFAVALVLAVLDGTTAEVAAARGCAERRHRYRGLLVAVPLLAAAVTDRWPGLECSAGSGQSHAADLVRYWPARLPHRGLHSLKSALPPRRLASSSSLDCRPSRVTFPRSPSRRLLLALHVPSQPSDSLPDRRSSRVALPRSPSRRLPLALPVPSQLPDSLPTATRSLAALPELPSPWWDRRQRAQLVVTSAATSHRIRWRGASNQFATALTPPVPAAPCAAIPSAVLELAASRCALVSSPPAPRPSRARSVPLRPCAVTSSASPVSTLLQRVRRAKNSSRPQQLLPSTPHSHQKDLTKNWINTLSYFAF